MREIPAVKEMMNRQGDRFRATFDVPLSGFMGKLIIFGIKDFDIVRFDKYLQNIGYGIRKDGSMEDYITKQYGQEATDLVREIIGDRQ